MATQASRSLAPLAAVAAVALASACTQILGVEDIPKALPDAGADASKRSDATVDARDSGHADAGHDARDSGKRDGRSDARETGPFDSGGDVSPGRDGGNDAPVGCGDAGATECSPDGLGFRTCRADGRWSAVTPCHGVAPVCLGGACRCVPNAGWCSDQQFEQCVVPDGGFPVFQALGPVCDAATCTLSGCGPVPRSCSTADASIGVSDCPQPDGGPPTESCCASNEVPGGSFVMSSDGVHYAVSVDGFRLDRFEVTVGRFREFYEAVNPHDLGPDAGVDAGRDAGECPAAWCPPAGSGKHTHLNGGYGLANRAPGGTTYETGWDPQWNRDLGPKMLNDETVRCDHPSLYTTWAKSPDTEGDDRAINCLTWAQAYAFCIWDNGFLPSEAEWNFAAAGGDEQRAFPWSPTGADGGTVPASCDLANYSANGSTSCFDAGPNSVATPSGGIEPVGILPGGDARWLQADMAGNVQEWTLDWYAAGYGESCQNCAFLPDGGAARVQRGGGFLSASDEITSSYRDYSPPTQPWYTAGVRCARTP
jgi:formylglycine-generating enzyme required for sulfatase activity